MSRSRLTFSPEEALRALWVRCLEEADATGALVPADARTSASREANTEDDAAFLSRRAALLEQKLRAGLQQPEVPAGKWIDRLPAWSPWAIVAGAFLLGWFTNELGPSGRINLLSFPLLGLILWNLTVCGASVWADWKARRKAAPPVSAPRRAAGMDALAAAKAAFEARALAWEKPRRNARMKWTFHAAAIALAAGIVAGMYVRGLGKNYKATWESTFLERPQVQALTGAVLGPASLITGIKVPEVPKAEHEVPAATWIHLWAASALLFIGIPRLLLANMARIEVNRTQPDYEAEFGSWLTVCRALTSEHTLKADVIPVHYEAEPKVRDGLRLVLQRLWGMHVGADFHAPVGYAEEQGFSLEMRPDYLVLLFPLATTPESEVHGALIQEMAANAPERHRRLIALDASGFEARFRTLPEYPERLAARRAAWEKIAGGAFPVLLLDDAARRDPAAAARTVFPT
ncbi:MAG TPA: DUF2868 domain-containing protein [Verrucomicrobiales bacterium]|nr:DUF2868 domain-containing protein [Verrucomicrobiales bacterium]